MPKARLSPYLRLLLKVTPMGHHIPDPSIYANKFSGKYSHRNINGGVGHNLPEEAPEAFAKAVADVDGYGSESGFSPAAWPPFFAPIDTKVSIDTIVQ